MEDTMHWMIDGAYGDLYREAMGHPAQTPAVDEWEIERRLNAKPKPRFRERFAGLRSIASAALFSSPGNWLARRSRDLSRAPALPTFRIPRSGI
jgi:hypothetical protein